MKNLKLLTLALFALVLAACGGGGGGGGGNPANPGNPDDAIPPDASNLTGLEVPPDPEMVEATAGNEPEHGSVTQSSNGSGGITTDTFSVSYDSDADKYTFTKTNSADSSKSWSPILVEQGDNGSGSLLFIDDELDHLPLNVLVHRIANDEFAWIQVNEHFVDANNWVVGGLWNILTDHDNKVSGFLDDLRAHVHPVSLTIDPNADIPDCQSPCRISWGEAGVFADGADWNGNLPVSGSANYQGQVEGVQANSLSNPDNAYAAPGESHTYSSLIDLTVTFSGGGASIMGDLGWDLALSETNWDSTRDNGSGAFYGENTVVCIANAAFCQSTGDSFFAAQFFGENGGDGNPNLIGGTYSVNDLVERGYVADDGSFSNSPDNPGDPAIDLTSDVIGGFTGVKQ